MGARSLLEHRLGLAAAASSLVALAFAACSVDERKLTLGTGGNAASGGDASTTGGSGGQAGGGGNGGTGGASGSTATGGAAGSGGAAGTGGGDACTILAAGVVDPTKIVATRCNSFVGESSIVKGVGDLSNFTIEVLKWDTGQNKFSSLAYQKTAPGTFEVKSAPAGAYYMHFNEIGTTQTWVVATTRVPDLGQVFLGRKNKVEPGPNQKLVLDITNANPWQDGDNVELFSAGAGLNAFNVDSVASTPPAVGANWLNFDFVEQDAPNAWLGLVDTDQGDVLWVTQLVNQAVTAPDIHVATLQRALQVPPPVKQSGVSTAVTGAFTAPVPKSQDLEVKIGTLLSLAVTPFAAQGIEYVGTSAGCWVDQSFNTVDNVLTGPDLFGWQTTATTDVTKTFGYGDPFPATLPRRCQGTVTTGRSYTLSGAPTKQFIAVSDFTADVPSGGGKVTLGPYVGPVQNLTVEGQNGLNDVTLSTYTPRIAWDPPSTGGGLQAAERYAVGLLEIYVGTNAQSQPVLKVNPAAVIYTPETELHVPPGVLQKGKYYIFRIWTSASGGVDRSVHFFHFGLPNSSTTLMSGLITAPTT